MRWAPVLACAFALLLAGCGGSSRGAATTTAPPPPPPPPPTTTTTKPPPPPPAKDVREEGPFGLADNQYWLFRPRGEPKSMVVFLHGLGPHLESLAGHRAWMRHLAERGSVVVYPRYELVPGNYGALKHLVIAMRAANNQLDFPHIPVIAIGYSRGGRLAVEYAAVSPMVAPQPVAVLSVFPGLLNPAAEEKVDLASLDPRTQIVLLAGDKDRSVGAEGAKAILSRLERAGFPAENVATVLVPSTKTWNADHDAVFDDNADAKREFWARADRLIEAVRP
jgi:predicted esterase